MPSRAAQDGMSLPFQHGIDTRMQESCGGEGDRERWRIPWRTRLRFRGGIAIANPWWNYDCKSAMELRSRIRGGIAISNPP